VRAGGGTAGRSRGWRRALRANPAGPWWSRAGASPVHRPPAPERGGLAAPAPQPGRGRGLSRPAGRGPAPPAGGSAR
jgi:hypothetical protein